MLPGITKNPAEEWKSTGNKKTAHRRGIHPRKGILLGITSSFKLIQTGNIKMREKFKYENLIKLKNFISFQLK
jgi:hypothetical protein